MLEEKKSEIARVFCEVLEKQVFLFPEPMDGGEMAAGQNGYVVSAMTFTGSAQGGLMVAVPETLAVEIAANFLGLDAEDPFVQASARDSLGEILNVTCGHMLSALYGESEVFDLSPPNSFFLTAAEVAILSRKPGCIPFSVDEHQVLLQASFCNQVAGETTHVDR